MCALAVGMRQQPRQGLSRVSVSEFCLRWCVYDLFSPAFRHGWCVVLLAARGNRRHRPPEAVCSLQKKIVTQHSAGCISRDLVTSSIQFLFLVSTLALVAHISAPCRLVPYSR